MAVRLSAQLLKRLDFAAALANELERAQDRLPSRTAEVAVTDHVDEYAALIAARCKAGFEPAREQIVWMPKRYLRYRPLAALPLAERVVYRAFAELVAREVAPLDSYRDTRDDFEKDILEADPKQTHFGLADVTSFYRYVSHRELQQRIVGATGLADLAEAVLEFLRAVTQGEVGLPQNAGPSDQFADLVIAPLERRLIRKGLTVSRFNDDFRIAGRSMRSVRHGLEDLQNELHTIGLTLNDSKTRILRRETFAEYVQEKAGDDYESGNDLGDAPATDALLKATKTALRTALGKKASSAGTSASDADEIHRVRQSLRRLSRWLDPYALGHGQAIVNRHPSLTQHYGRYLARLVADERGEEVAEYLEGVFPKLILTPWQEAWLLEPIIEGAAPIGNRLKGWLRARFEERGVPPVLRARAAYAAAAAGLVEAGDVLRLIDSLPEVARPDAIAAFAVASDGDEGAIEELAGLDESRLATWIFEAHVG